MNPPGQLITDALFTATPTANGPPPSHLKQSIKVRSLIGW